MQYRHRRIVAIAIFAVGLLVLWLHDITPAEHQPPVSLTVAEKPPRSSSNKSNTITNGVAAAARSVSSSSKSSVTGHGKEICGIGVFDSVPGNADEIQKRIEEKTQHVWQDWKGAMLSSDDVAARAAGLYLSGASASNGNSGFNKTFLEKLVQLAINSRNAAAYGIAYHACDKAYNSDTKEICSPITASEWAERDADNAVPWLLIAVQQDSNGHHAEALNALQQATEASRIDSYGETLSSKANWLKPADISPLTLNQLEMTIFGNQAAWNMLQFGPIHQFCLNGKSSLSDDARKQYCGKLGRLLIDRGTSAIDLGIGRKLGEQAGWPKDETDRLKELLAAMQSTFESMVPASLDCKSLEQVNNYFLMRAELGERGLAQLMIDHSGKSMEELARQYRESSKQP